MKRHLSTIGIVFLFISICEMTRAQNNFWEQTNGPYGGRIYSISIANDNTIYASTEEGGVYISKNKGVDWLPINSGLPLTTTVYALTTTSNNNIFAGTSLGIYVMNVTNEKWMLTHQSREIRALATNSQNHVFAGAYFGIVYRTTNSGTTWERITVDPSKSSDINAIVINEAGNVFCATTGSKIFRSTDYGNTWVQLWNGLTAKEINGITITKDGILYAATEYGVYKSVDNGNSWQSCSSVSGAISVYRVAADTNNIIYTSQWLGGLFRSTDSGLTWIALNSEKSKQTIYSIAVDRENHLLVGTSGEGIMRSSDAGITWYFSNQNLKSTKIFSFTEMRDGTLFAGAEGCMFRSFDNGKNWESITKVIKGTYLIRSLVTDIHENVYASIDIDGVYKSSDGGNTWSKVLDAKLVASVFTMATNSRGDIYAGTYGKEIMRSTNGGMSWAKTNAGLLIRDINSIYIDKNDYIYAGGLVVSDIYRTTNNGNSWLKLHAGTVGQIITDIAVNSKGQIFASNGIDFYRSTDDGFSWDSIRTFNAGSIKICSNDIVLAGARTGVYRSTDDGISWKNLSTETLYPPVNSLFVNSKGYVFFGTVGNGVYRSVNSLTLENSYHRINPMGSVLHQNYPNPFGASTPSVSSSTTISFSLPRPTHVTLKIFNSLGVEIQTLINNEEYDIGVHSVEFAQHASNFEFHSGVYFYKLSTPDFVETKKMVVLR